MNLNLNYHIEEKMTKEMNRTGVIKSQAKYISTFTMYKYFVRPHLDYGNVLYDQPNNESLCEKVLNTIMQYCYRRYSYHQRDISDKTLQ